MRKLLSVLAGGALAIMLSAPAASADGSAQSRVEHHHCPQGLIGRLVEDVLGLL
jgi:hypothetical protein